MAITVKLDGVDITSQLNAQSPLNGSIPSVSPYGGGEYDLKEVIANNPTLRNNFFSTPNHKIQISTGSSSFMGVAHIGAKYSSRNR